jgi:hypothetical protein
MADHREKFTGASDWSSAVYCFCPNQPTGAAFMAIEPITILVILVIAVVRNVRISLKIISVRKG